MTEKKQKEIESLESFVTKLSGDILHQKAKLGAMERTLETKIKKLEILRNE